MPAPQPAAPAAPATPGSDDLPLVTAPRTPSAGSADSPTGSSAAQRLLSPAGDPRPITLWGSSSMSSEGGTDATPLPMRIHEHLSLAACPAEVHGFGVGATMSHHTVLMRGLDTPVATPAGEQDPATGSVAVTLDSGLAPQGPIAFPASIGQVAGTLDGSSGTWIFTPEDRTASIAAAPVVSALAEVAEGSRQLLWMGKNNIHQVEKVLQDTQRMWDATDTPEQDTLVLGQWATEHDPAGSETGEALATVNAVQSSRYGDHFLDLQSILTSEDGLTSTPIAGLALLEQGSTQEALERSVVPPMLIAHDTIHLNGWGNLVVCWALISRLRELRWL